MSTPKQPQRREGGLKIVTFKASEFAKNLPKNKLHLLEGVHEDKHCYYAWKNGKLLGIVYDLKIFKK